MARGMEHRAAPAGGTGRSLPRIVERWARERPDAPAVSGIGGSLDYAGLNRRANRIAACLAGMAVLFSAFCRSSSRRRRGSSATA